jgi:hypothetical protein
MAVDRMKASENIGALAHELGVTRRVLYKWRDRLEPLERATRYRCPIRMKPPSANNCTN